MAMIGLWYPIYNRHLSWVGIRLETAAEEAASPGYFSEVSADLQTIDAIGNLLVFVGADVLATGDNSSPLPFPPAQLVIVLNEALLPDGMQAENCRAKRAQGARLAVTGLEAAPGLVPDMISAHILDAATARDTLGEEVLRSACN